MNVQRCKLLALLVALLFAGATYLAPKSAASGGSGALDDALRAVLDQHGFTGRVGQSLEQRLGRKVDTSSQTSGGSRFTTRCSA